MKSKHLVIIYFILLVLEILGEVVADIHGIFYGIWTFKPLLMPILMFWYYKETKGKTSFDKVILASLFFSWWGDNFLMPGIFKSDINFLLGLASFLIAHVLYIAAFAKTTIENPSVLRKKPYLGLFFVLFGVSLVSFLFKQGHPDFAEMSIPVMVYASVIMVMVITAINRFGRVPAGSFKWVLIGALLFMISDSLIALSRFTYVFDGIYFLARMLIMPLYVIGQYYIIKGCILQHGDSN